MYEKEVAQELAMLRKEKRREMRNLMKEYDEEEVEIMKVEIMKETVQRKFKKKERAVKQNRADVDSVLCEEVTKAVQDAARLEAEALAARDEAQRILYVSVLCVYVTYIFWLFASMNPSSYLFVSILTFTGVATGQEAVACQGD